MITWFMHWSICMYRCTFMHIQGLSKFLDKGDKSTVDASWVRPECLFLFNKETCPLVQQEYRCQFGQENTSSSSTTRHVFWLNEQTRPLAPVYAKVSPASLLLKTTHTWKHISWLQDVPGLQVPPASPSPVWGRGCLRLSSRRKLCFQSTCNHKMDIEIVTCVCETRSHNGCSELQECDKDRPGITKRTGLAHMNMNMTTYVQISCLWDLMLMLPLSLKRHHKTINICHTYAPKGWFLKVIFCAFWGLSSRRGPKVPRAVSKAQKHFKMGPRNGFSLRFYHNYVILLGHILKRQILQRVPT